MVCEECSINSPHQVANIDEIYEKDISHFRWMCVSCHAKLDGRGRHNCIRRPSWCNIECSICSYSKTGYKRCGDWIVDKGTGLFICRRCYNRKSQERHRKKMLKVL